MKFTQFIYAIRFFIPIILLTMTSGTINGQSPPPCPPPPTVNYTLTVSPTNTVTAGTTVIFKVMDSGGNLITDACIEAEWYVNDTLVFSRPLGDGSTSTSYGYSSNLFKDNDIVTCYVFQSCGCAKTTIYPIDNPITMHVSGILPIELRDFRGFTEGGINHLVWATASEINNKGFQIERLNSSGKTWDVLGFVPAQGKAANYEFTDKHPLSIGYYRLRQIDLNGKEQLSKVINLLITNKKMLVVYPNPTAQFLNIDVSSSFEKENPFFQIFNILGQQVQTGTLTQTIDVSNLVLGTYILKVGTEQIKFHKQ